MPLEIKFERLSPTDIVGFIDTHTEATGAITLQPTINPHIWKAFKAGDKSHPTEDNCHKITQHQLEKWMNSGTVTCTVAAHWSAVSFTIGACAGSLWMGLETFITAEAPMILTVFGSTLLTYAATEILTFRYKHERWPTFHELTTIARHTRDLGLKVALSVAGWMTGASIAANHGLGGISETVLIAVCDALAVGIANIANELPNCNNKREIISVLWDTAGLMAIVGGAATIWQKVSVHKPTGSRLGDSIVNGLSIGAEFFVPYKLGGWIKSCLSSAQNENDDERTKLLLT